MLDLTPLKHHLRIDHDDEDALLTAYLNAAKSTFELWTARKLIMPPDTLPDKDKITNELMINDAIKQGALLLIGHWYAHREAVSDRLLHTTPYAVEALWLPYKYRRV
ncbi:hypothetical protein AXE65_11605 [Ventosimonas gracilis]|uniref:Phage gp6-like head-tail connector protein n=1 Tax=Ventosimonas gracilis TaxID=1680762 RepID=A0A139SW65_9GAMM|nr:head-tail connector protein [Ventosimonas gracilis]KXU38866.1 hypothetical protein AXE65_11605 [Ventosimonas gracilis]